MMTDLLEALGLVDASPLIAVVGAGGKTSLCWQLSQALKRQRRQVLFTTTTRVWEPQSNAFDVQISHHHIDNTLTQLRNMPWHSACVLGAIGGEVGPQPVIESRMPVLSTKRMGLTSDDICQLHAAFPEVVVIVEADGARGLLLKAPGDTEPVIPACADVVCVVACLDAIGQPLDERIVHRPERFAALSGLRVGEVIDAQAIGTVLCHPQGGRKTIPPNAKAIAVLTQHDDKTAHIAASSLTVYLTQCGFDRVVLVNPRANDASAIAVTSA